MHEYDTVLKSLLAGSENSILERITGARRGSWLNVELPEVMQTRVDLLFKTAGKRSSGGGRIINLELQSWNDWLLPLRMAEYSLRVYRRLNQFPEQFVLYLGRQKLRMPSELKGPDHYCRYTIVEIRNWDAETLLASPFPADVVMAILARYSNRLEMVKQILMRIAKLELGAAKAAFSKLMILAGLRGLENTIAKEAQKMPVLNDIMEHRIIGPAIRKGREQGLEQGLEQGRQTEAAAILRRLLKERFGRIPASFGQRLKNLSTAELEELAVRLIRAQSLAELFEQD